MTSLPPWYLGRPWNVWDQSSPEMSTGSPLSRPSALSCTLTDWGRLPSRSPSSSQTFFTVTEVSSGACLFVMVKPSLALPDLEDWYPPTETSFTS